MSGEFSPDTLRWLAYHHPDDFPVLLDSASEGALARYSVLGALPRERWCLSAAEAPAGGFLERFDQRWQQEVPHGSGALHECPFRGGWMVYLGYEIAREIEPRLGHWPLEPTEPAAIAWRIPAALVYDHALARGWLVAEGDEELRALQRHLASVPASARLEASAPAVQGLESEAPERYRERVRAAIEHIRAGDVYQANLSRGWEATLVGGAPGALGAGALYERLRRANPAPFAAWCHADGFSLLSSSPERLVSASGRRVDTRPIAGTRPRSADPARHAHEQAALLAHPKERAEHVMLIDLERNDLGRVCRAGSVHVDEFMVIESYRHVHHIVSNVTGELRPDVRPVQLLRAVFPGGTITGCPKLRCMQIIAELEGQPRGAYTGALGYVNHDGSLDFNILIRTMTVREGRLRFRAGAGIVADSQPEAELQETIAKARGLLQALQGGAHG